MKTLKRSLQKRFIGIVTLHTFVTLVSIYGITVFNLYRSSKWELSRFTDTLVEALEEQSSKDLNYSFLSLGVGEESRFSFKVKFNDGNIIEAGAFAETLTEGSTGFTALGYKAFAVYQTRQSSDYELSSSIVSELDLIDDVLWIFLLLFPILLLPALYLSNRSFEQVTSPLQKIFWALHKIEKGEFGTRITQGHAHEEIEQLIQTLNQAFEKLEILFQHSRHFNAHAAHQLKTPLAVIKGEIGICFEADAGVENYEECLGKVQREVYHLTGVIDSLLMISSPEKEEGKGFHDFSMMNCWERISELVDVMAREKSIQLIVNLDDFTLHGSEKLMSQAFFNLLENAIKYSPEKSTIKISLTGKSFSVEDQAPKLSVEDQENILKPFFRKSPTAPGSGLGLNVVEWICKVHSFELVVGTSGSGNVFTIKF